MFSICLRGILSSQFSISGKRVMPHSAPRIDLHWPTYLDEFAPVGKISRAPTYSARSALMSASKTNGSTTPARLIAIRSSRSTRTVRGISQMAWINKRPTTSTIWKPPFKPRMAPDSSKGSAPTTFTPKRLATRGTGQARTQRAAEHGSITPYPTTPGALDRYRDFLRFLPLRFEAD